MVTYKHATNVQVNEILLRKESIMLGSEIIMIDKYLYPVLMSQIANNDVL